ncbi:MAG: PilZ domain-containing protein [Planctomycetota bacterium]
MTQPFIETWNQVITELVRNESAVLVTHADEEELDPVGRAGVYVQGPPADSGACGLTIGVPSGLGRVWSVGQQLTVIAYRGDLRVAGVCTVRSRATRKINASQSIKCLELAGPAEVESGQRRERFRAEVTGIVNGEVWLAPLTDQGTEPEDRLITAHLIDIGGGGARIRLIGDERDVKRDAAWDRFALRIPLPDDNSTMLVYADVAHRRRVELGTTDLGLQFTGAPMTLAEIDDRLLKLVAWVQRRELTIRRERDAA